MISNRLIHQKSPYLLQHAHNPVDWHPWGSEAFERARKEDKPIFLSIGYSTCHWCHVMEKESFENLAIAKVLNDYFVSIKVDREERPDLDQVYMAATQAMTGSGGWPMSVWLNHDLKPFYTGTYFPPQSHYGRPGFKEVLLKIHEAWTHQRKKVDESGDRLAEALKEQNRASPGEEELSKGVLLEGYQYFERAFDPAEGGFGQAPKFPRPVQFDFLFRYHASTGEKHALEMALFTLRKMAHGGIYDHLGGGFHRYSVDGEWRVPHFEKMLYDHGQLLSVYTSAWQITHEDFYRDVARDIIRYVTRDMTAPSGAFFSAEDADSEGVEGTFYVWSEDELKSLLGTGPAGAVAAHYDFLEGGNFEHGKNVLHSIHSIEETAKKIGKSEKETAKILEDARKKMFEARSQRSRPHLDDKILTGWNGLMISGFARAGNAFGEFSFMDCAAKAADFILTHLRESPGHRLLHRYRDGEAKGAAFLDDYAFLAAGLLDLFEATQDPRWLAEAERLIHEQIELLWDSKEGGFFFAGVDDPSLLFRPKSDYEGAEPSGNSIAALNLLRLAHLTGQQDFRDKFEKTLNAFAPGVRRFPAAMPMMLCAFLDSLHPPRQVVIAGDPSRADTQNMFREANRHYLPNTSVLLAGGDARQVELSRRMPFFSEIKPLNGKPTAFICQNYACHAPITDLETLRGQLELKIERKGIRLKAED